MFSILSDHRLYLRMWLSQVISYLGDGITRVALIYLIGKSSSHSLLIGMVIFVQLFPTAVLSLVFGPLVDRFSKRRLMVFSDLYRMIIVLCMAAFAHSPIILLVLLGLHGIGTALFVPAQSSIVPSIIPKERIPEAIALSNGTASAMQIIAPAIGGLFLLSERYDINFMVNAATFLLSAILIWSIKFKEYLHHKQKKSGYWLDALTGYRDIFLLPILRFFLFMMIPLSFVIGILNTNLVSALLHHFHVSPSHFGFLEASIGVGAILGSLLGPKLLQTIPANRLLWIGMMLIGVWMAGIVPLNVFVHNWGDFPLYTWCTMVGVLNALVNVPINSLFISIVPQELRGSGSALMTTFSNFPIMLGIMIGGWYADVIGSVYATATSGILLVLTTCTYPLFQGYRQLSQVAFNTERSSIEG
ncbi:MFS transporter [[Bacillus] caldolyticus]|uniref:MFS transporter n=3 Tax=Anoxybacillaceae TaxID=3120669 RepID=A0ABN5FUV1_BACCL|nr:MFS transporter [[Bacillus] caldolyticus]EQB94371.1 hypothetical protein GA8_17340 [Geobacillus sp. A8]KDE45961.1 hypothetical protein DI44_18295 [Geobacillus sp. CAMR5420]KQC48406.1 hypothetical protein AP057_14295 [Geobacillus sp. Sah69]KZE97715.1 Enterobactin exporter EntS [Geobacillus stearothermophilus]PJW13077.1 MFS transporter [Geobacillus sp. Manikaran-105]PJW16090.1 MFS transporter [Geobacillus sp. WSUCF-018B]